ncbi:MAG: glycerol-3-phosphate 1-O-acyltransferase PlsY [Gemmatimonadaceae bacterium]
MHPALAVLIGYLVGSIPTAYLAGRLLRGVDLRTVGSGNLGATNVYRNLGAAPAAVVLLFDGLKGALPVLLLPGMLEGTLVVDPRAPLWWSLAIGLAAIFGHAKPIFLLWKGGGKGVATGAGVFAALAPIAVGAAVVVFAVAAAVTGFVSLASLLAAWTIPLALVVLGGPLSPVVAVATLVAAFVTWSHRANISRLRAGTEPRTFRRTQGGVQ